MATRRESLGALRIARWRAPSNSEELDQSVLVCNADVSTRLLAAFEDHDGRHTADSELGCGDGRVVDVELPDADLPFEVIRNFLDDRTQNTARTAPDRAEIEEERKGGLEDLAVEVQIVDLQNICGGHGTPNLQRSQYYSDAAMSIAVAPYRNLAPIAAPGYHVNPSP